MVSKSIGRKVPYSLAIVKLRQETGNRKEIQSV